MYVVGGFSGLIVWGNPEMDDEIYKLRDKSTHLFKSKKFNKGQIFLAVMAIILIIGIADIGNGIIDYKSTLINNGHSYVTVVIERAYHIPMYGHDIWPETWSGISLSKHYPNTNSLNFNTLFP
jgi:hypothetical protein